MEFINACQNGDVDTVRRLVSDDAYTTEVTDISDTQFHGMTGLMWASYYGHLPVMQCLIEEFDANIYERCKKGNTALMCACEGGRLEAIRYLISRSACPQDRNKSGQTALHVACDYNSQRYEVIDFLVNECRLDPDARNYNGESCFMAACEQEDLGKAQHFANVVGVNTNTRNKNGKTPLMSACQSQSRRMVRWLVLETGADVNAQDSRGRTPLMYACEQPEFLNCYIVWFLCKQGRANVNIRDNRGENLLTMSLQNRQWSLANYVIRQIGHRQPAPWRGA